MCSRNGTFVQFIFNINDKPFDLSFVQVTQNDNSSDGCSTTNELSTTLARILVCKPHSADCERLISAYNRLKSAYRCSLDQETIGNYLYVHTNMPPLSGFDPRPAVLHWLSVTERRHRETPKASKQEWFSTVFFGSNEVEIQRERSNSKVVKKF